MKFIPFSCKCSVLNGKEKNEQDRNEKDSAIVCVCGLWLWWWQLRLCSIKTKTNFKTKYQCTFCSNIDFMTNHSHIHTHIHILLVSNSIRALQSHLCLLLYKLYYTTYYLTYFLLVFNFRFIIIKRQIRDEHIIFMIFFSINLVFDVIAGITMKILQIASGQYAVKSAHTQFIWTIHVEWPNQGRLLHWFTALLTVAIVYFAVSNAEIICILSFHIWPSSFRLIIQIVEHFEQNSFSLWFFAL